MLQQEKKSQNFSGIKQQRIISCPHCMSSCRLAGVSTPMLSLLSPSLWVPLLKAQPSSAFADCHGRGKENAESNANSSFSPEVTNMLLFTFNWPKQVTQLPLVSRVGDRMPSQGKKLDIHVQKYTKATGLTHWKQL